MSEPYLHRLGLEYNPFEPAASGAPVRSELWLPDSWRQQVEHLLTTLESSSGTKALAIEGEYGSGKTYLLRWLEQEAFPARRIRSFYFDNPGVQFYDLANHLLRQIGRYELAKTLWEYSKPQIASFQPLLLREKDDFVTWLTAVKRQKRQDEAKNALARAILKHDITTDEEIAHRLAMMTIHTIDKPFFEYRDFVAGRKDALVAENEEARYFSAIIRMLRLTGSVQGIAFLLDEFEEVSLQKRLSRKQAHDYLATLKRLLNVASREDFWLVISMTPQAADISQQLETSLWERFTGQGQYQFRIPELSENEATELLHFRLATAQVNPADTSRLWPFSDGVVASLRPTTYSSPRRLIKVGFYALAEACQQEQLELPLSSTFLQEIENKVYPVEEIGE